MKWINVKDELPPIGKSVFFYTTDGFRTEGERRENEWIQYRWFTILPYEEVTHWMDVPDPPEEEITIKDLIGERNERRI